MLNYVSTCSIRPGGAKNQRPRLLRPHITVNPLLSLRALMIFEAGAVLLAKESFDRLYRKNRAFVSRVIHRQNGLWGLGWPPAHSDRG